MRHSRSGQRGVVRRGVVAGSVCFLLASFGLLAQASPAISRPVSGVAPRAIGALDCNGFSPIQRNPKVTGVCTDAKGYDGGRFYDNGHYVGHDEPIIRFMSGRSGSANDIVWNETLPMEPAANPTVHTPGADVTYSFELTVAPWFS